MAPDETQSPGATTKHRTTPPDPIPEEGPTVMCRSKDQGGRRCPGGSRCTTRHTTTVYSTGPRRATPTPSPQDAVRAAYAAVARPGQVIPLSEVRRHLATTGLTRAQVDDALDELITDPRVSLPPEANQKTLTDTIRAAAVEVGGELRHYLVIDTEAGAFE